jgi:hypothetical protein
LPYTLSVECSILVLEDYSLLHVIAHHKMMYYSQNLIHGKPAKKHKAAEEKLKAAEEKAAKKATKDAQKAEQKQAREAAQQLKKDNAAAEKLQVAEAKAIKAAAKRRARSRSPVSRAKRAKKDQMRPEHKWHAAVDASQNFSGGDQCAGCHVWWEKLEEQFHPDPPGCDWFSCSTCSLSWCGFCWTEDDDEQHTITCSNTLT